MSVLSKNCADELKRERLYLRPLEKEMATCSDMTACTHAQILKVACGLEGKESTCHTGHSGEVGLIPGSGRYPGAGSGNRIQYSYLGMPMKKGVWWATVQVVTKSQT